MCAGWFANHRKRGDAAHSPAERDWREVPRSSSFVKHMDCDAFRRFAPAGCTHTPLTGPGPPEQFIDRHEVNDAVLGKADQRGGGATEFDKG
jgi:hypothetical protein